MHSVMVLLWLVSVGAENVGESLAQPGGPFDRLVYRRNHRRPEWHGHLGRWARVWLGRPLGWLLRVAVPSIGTAMRLAEPVAGAISWAERYPQYRVM
jgi:hypothetical protein